MHMADALISPAVGGAMWAVSAGAMGYCSKKVREELAEQKVPLMGVLGAFIFTAQMINFTIPATGSSGHLGGGLLLAVLLGPYAAFLVTASVLVIQAFFFADGGLLALGCNIFNLGFFPAFIAYPFFRSIAGSGTNRKRLAAASVIAATLGLEMGAFGVVLETVASGIASLPFAGFSALMLSIHLVIGLVEGMVTATVVSLVAAASPELLSTEFAPFAARHSARTASATILTLALLTGGFLSWFASEQPDGLEWSIEKATGGKPIKETDTAVHAALSALQRKSSLFPDYAVRSPAAPENAVNSPPGTADMSGRQREGNHHTSTGLAGIAGGLITLAVTFVLGILIRKPSKSAG